MIIAALAAFAYIQPRNVFAAAPANNARTGTLLEQARAEFVAERYDKAIKLYRKYLRRNPKEADVWGQLASCYYFIGEPDKAIDYLKKFENAARIKSYNYFYQGMAYEGSKRPELAEAYLIKAARFTDEYAARAVYELATIFYNQRENVKAAYWLRLYRQRFPQGGYIRFVMRMEQSITEGNYVEGFKGVPKPDFEAALYRYHWRSFYNAPHFWFAQFGYQYDQITQADPKPENPQGFALASYSKHGALLNSGFGVGPYKSNDIVTHVGYKYLQNWLTDDERVTDFKDDPSDFSYFPYRPDLLERQHQLFIDSSYVLNNNFSFGAFAQFEFKRVGSDLIPGPEQTDAEQHASTVSRTSLLLPFAQADYAHHFSTRFSLFLKKELNEESPELSNKTYNFLEFSDPLLSAVLSQKFLFPEYGVMGYVDLFQFEYMFNDRWQDYSRRGILAGLEYEFERNFFVTGAIAYYQDIYELPQIKQQNCQFTKSDKTTASDEPQYCPREDTGTAYQVGLYWNVTEFDRIAAKFTILDNKNPDQQVFDRMDSIFWVMATMSFPSAKKIAQFTERTFDFISAKDVD